MALSPSADGVSYTTEALTLTKGKMEEFLADTTLLAQYVSREGYFPLVVAHSVPYTTKPRVFSTPALALTNDRPPLLQNSIISTRSHAHRNATKDLKDFRKNLSMLHYGGNSSVAWREPPVFIIFHP